MPLSDKAKENKKQYIRDYTKKNLKRIPLNVQRSKYDEILQASKNVGESVNGYIKKAIDMRLDIDCVNLDIDVDSLAIDN